MTLRWGTEDEAAVRLRSLDTGDEAPEPRVVIPGNHATPWTLLRLLDCSVERYRAFVLNAQAGWPCRPGVITETPFVGPGVREDTSLDYLPMRLSLVPRLFDSMRPPDAVLVHCAPPRSGKVSLGIEVNILPAAIERVRARGGLVIAQVNPRMPFTHGDGEFDCEDIDLAIEVDQPLTSPTPRPVDPATEAIGRRAADFASDGCTLQLGIGQVPNAAAAQLARYRHLGVWSEMISDGILTLLNAGALDERRLLQASFLFGSEELYCWADGNPLLHMTRTETINDPARIAANPAMLSLNTALEVDLYAQANASYVDQRVYSGLGGQPDFVVGALHSVGGHALVALRSWHAATDTSTIVPVLPRPVTSLQHSAIITEQGSAEIFGRSQSAQARLIIENCAHPRARDGLREAARKLGLSRDVSAPA